MNKPFKSDLVLREEISETSLRAYHVGFDQNKFRLNPLVDIIRKVIPEFAFGIHDGNTVLMTEIVDKLQEAALSVFDTDKYKKRGEFGELILHLLLRDYCNTVPLVSKIYFKDSINVAAHGFDGVQVTVDGKINKLWLGESKLYVNGKAGIMDLVKDLKTHVEADYLRKEFSLIKRKVPINISEREKWIELLDKHQTLDKIFASIVIPLVCTYSSSIFANHKAETKQYLNDFKVECGALHQMFNNKKIKTKCEVVLMLLPVPSKDELNTQLFKRLKAMQKI